MKRFLPHFVLLAALVFITCSDDEVTAPTNPPPGPPEAPEFVTLWGAHGTGDGQFDIPYGVASDADGNVYVADTGNNRVQKFSSDGMFVTKWGSTGSGDGQFNSPSGIACDAAGNVYVADRFNYRVQKFTSAGVFVTKWGVQGGGDGQFENPMGIACDSQGNVFVAEDRVQWFTGDGTFLGKAPGTSYGVTCGNDGYYYSTDYYQGFVRKVRIEDSVRVLYWGSNGSGDGEFNHPTMITCDDKRGILYVVDRDNSRVQMFDREGIYLDEWGTQGTQPGSFNWATGIALDGDGNVYVADTSNHRIQKFR